MLNTTVAVTRIAHGLLPAEFAPDAAPAKDEPSFSQATVLLAHGQIRAIIAPDTGPDAGPDRASDAALPWLDATGCTVLPGFIDLHVHGAAGHDTMDATPAALTALATFFTQHGVTGFLPTTMTADRAATLAAVRNVTATGAVDGGARVLGVHLEGPFISPKFPGAQRADQIRPPDVTEFAALLQAGPVRMITLAPEVDGAAQLMAMARAEDVVVVVGHTNADYDVCQAAFAAGASQATHTYNAMTGLHHRRPGTLGAVLTNDTVDAQLIADNIHVHPAAMEILARCKGPQRTLLITDAMRAAGLPPGRYELGGQPVTVANHACRLEDGTLAGSVLTMERALANFMAANSWPLHKAWPATSRNAARALGMDDRLGEIKSGYWADLVLLDEELTVVATIVDGQVVYLRDEERLHG